MKVLTQSIDNGTPEGRLFFHMTAAFDEFQRELIVENTRAGLKAAAKRGGKAWADFDAKAETVDFAPKDFTPALLVGLQDIVAEWGSGLE